MKVLSFQQLPYRHLPQDFAQKYNSVVTTPYHELVDPALMHQDHVHFLDEMMRTEERRVGNECRKRMWS